MQAIGTIEGLYRYPVKSMAGESLEEAPLGFRGIEGDRRFALRLVNSTGEFPWLQASKHPALLCYHPYRSHPAKAHPDRVMTPSGADVELAGDALRLELSGAFGSELQLMQLKHGIFDDGDLSLISTATIREIERRSGLPLDILRFRPNMVVKLAADLPFEEDAWVGKVVVIGEGDTTPAIAITMKDLRCAMVNLDPETCTSNPDILKTIARAHEAYAGVYGAVLRKGIIRVGDQMFLKDV